MSPQKGSRLGLYDEPGVAGGKFAHTEDVADLRVRACEESGVEGDGA